MAPEGEEQLGELSLLTPRLAARSFFSHKPELKYSSQLLNKIVLFGERLVDKRLTAMEVHIFPKNVQSFLLLENGILVQG